jgi:hypothetical protein
MVRDAKNNITAFNVHVHEQMNALSARGETSNDRIVNLLLRGYMACSDKKFVEYMEKFWGEYE